MDMAAQSPATQNFSDAVPDEAFVKRALDMANLNALRVALWQATGDAELARMGTVAVPFWSGVYDVIQLAPEHAERVKAKALAFLRSGAGSRLPHPEDVQIRDMMAMLAGKPVSDFIFEMGKEELNFVDYPRGVAWSGDGPPEGREGFHVLVIGAGVAGLVTAIHLGHLGIPYTIVERNPDVGGTWWTNDYPDARVDIPSHHYQLTVTRKHPWQHWFAPQPELADYIRTVADDHDLRRNIRFETEVAAAHWDESAKVWRIRLRDKGGTETAIAAHAIVSGAGLFNVPNTPDIPGVETYRGAFFHTTNWDHRFDHADKRVGVIGVGCTGAQVMPSLAETAGHVTVFQRSPHWVAKLEGYRDRIPDEVQWLMEAMPHYWNWYVFATYYTMFCEDGALFSIDRDWQREGGLVSRKNDALRQALTDAIAREFPDDPALARKLTPDCPPFSRRLVVDNGWFRALKQPHVSLVTAGITRMTPAGVVTDDGVEHPLDLVVWAGGFRAERYLWPVHYVGRHGRTLEEAWAKDGARAYLGMTMPDFPNMFMLYGPNTNPRAGGLFAWIEIWARYAVQGIAALIEGGHAAMECRRDVHDAFNAEVDAALGDCIWGLDGQASYYRNRHGRQGINNPLRPSVYYDKVRKINLADFVLD